MAFLLQQLLAETARRRPDHDAVVCRDRAVTYRELDGLSDGLAATLTRHGVRPGDRVGIYLNKSVESVIAIFGIMKAGGAYVPLDPGAPPPRIAYIVGNCAMKAIVTNQRKAAPLAAALTASPLACVILVDAAPESGATVLSARALGWMDAVEGGSAPPVQRIESDLGYILYTSGSTGEPKGVMISHRAALTFVDWAVDEFRLTPADRLSNHAPLHFDLSIFDIFGAVKAGATVIMVPEDVALFPVNMADFIERERITVWYSVPSALIRMLLHGQLERHSFAALRTLLFAGEVFPVKYLRGLRERIPHAEYANLYGPTETNVCTYYRVAELAPDRVEPLPIGRACANTETFIVTDDGRLGQVGDVGELFVRGPGLMRGYWGLDERTAIAMVPHPVAPAYGELVYRTGDLVRLEADGDYTFLGRRDNQIKSRGYRIELGEIETVLYSHPGIEEAAAIAIPDQEVGNLIKAVVAPRADRELTRGELEAWCLKRLPRYMVPAFVELRPGLPKTSTGKVDRTLLVREHMANPGAEAAKGEA